MREALVAKGVCELGAALSDFTERFDRFACACARTLQSGMLERSGEAFSEAGCGDFESASAVARDVVDRAVLISALFDVQRCLRLAMRSVDVGGVHAFVARSVLVDAVLGMERLGGYFRSIASIREGVPGLGGVVVFAEQMRDLLQRAAEVSRVAQAARVIDEG